MISIPRIETPIFEIIDGDKHYKIWEYGKIEGFSEKAHIRNDTYKLVDAALFASERHHADLAKQVLLVLTHPSLCQQTLQSLEREREKACPHEHQ